MYVIVSHFKYIEASHFQHPNPSSVMDKAADFDTYYRWFDPCVETFLFLQILKPFQHKFFLLMNRIILSIGILIKIILSISILMHKIILCIGIFYASHLY